MVFMNERTKELAEQAGSTHKQSLGVYQFYEFELEKFAELLVRECMGVVSKKCASPTAYNALVEHFGIKDKL